METDPGNFISLWDNEGEDNDQDGLTVSLAML